MILKAVGIYKNGKILVKHSKITMALMGECSKIVQEVHLKVRVPNSATRMDYLLGGMQKTPKASKFQNSIRFMAKG